jgi:hypothetical protein
MNMTYLTGETINTSSVEWTTERGACCTLTLVRNATLGVNGWLQSASHAMLFVVNGNPEPYCGVEDHATLGTVVKARMGKAQAPVATSAIVAVKALANEYRDHNNTVTDAQIASADEYQRQHDAIERMR